MQIAKLFTNGHSQAVRLPKECRFKEGSKEVYAHRIENIVMLIPKKNPWDSFLHGLGKFSDDFMSERHQPSHSDRREKFA